MASRLDTYEDLLMQTLHGEGDSDPLAMTLFGIVTTMKAKNVLELGARDGGTTIPLLAAVEETGGILTSVDVSDDSIEKVRHQIRLHQRDESRWFGIARDANAALRDWAHDGLLFDVIYVDDWHSYEHVRQELEYIDKLVSPKSLVLLHDLMYANYEPHYHTDIACRHGQWANGGPYRAVAELNDNFWEFSTIPISNGLTILRKKYSKLYHAG